MSDTKSEQLEVTAESPQLTNLGQQEVADSISEGIKEAVLSSLHSDQTLLGSEIGKAAESAIKSILDANRGEILKLIAAQAERS